MKKLLLLLVLAFVLVLAGCSTAVGDDSDVAGVSELLLTREELSVFNGEDGNPAYIAVDGVIYDVSDVPEWSGGAHNGFTAGRDLTDEIKNVSPHGVSKLKGLTIVGKLSD